MLVIGCWKLSGCLLQLFFWYAFMEGDAGCSVVLVGHEARMTSPPCTPSSLLSLVASQISIIELTVDPCPLHYAIEEALPRPTGSSSLSLPLFFVGSLHRISSRCRSRKESAFLVHSQGSTATAFYDKEGAPFFLTISHVLLTGRSGFIAPGISSVRPTRTLPLSAMRPLAISSTPLVSCTMPCVF